LPAYLVNAYFDRAKALVAASTKLPDVLKAFKGLNVTQTQLETHVGDPADKWTPEDFAVLRGVYTAIRDGAMSVEEAFAPPPVEGASPPGVVTPDSILGGAVTSETGVDPGAAHRPASDPNETELSHARSNAIAAMDRLKLSGPDRIGLIGHHAKANSLGAASLDGLNALLDALKKLDESRKAK
jgi:hypothetical protein